jgi:hypothetical protein
MQRLRRNNQTQIGEDRWIIGIVNGITYWTNIAVDHQSGRITNEYLMGFSDHQLENMAYGDLKNHDRIKTEKYIRSTGDQGGTPGEIYNGAHRAIVIIAFRLANRIADNKAKALEQEAMATAN